MVEFKVLAIKEEKPNRFDVIVQYTNGNVEQFGFPKGSGFRDEVDGVPKFVKHIVGINAKRDKAKKKNLSIYVNKKFGKDK